MGYTLLCCGSNGQYQLGIGNDEDQDSLVAAQFEVDGSVVTELKTRPLQVVCGGNHTLVILESHEVYSSGDNAFGQCGITGEESVPRFRKIEGSWRSAACGWEFSVLISVTGEVYTCGRGLKGELGLGKATTSGGLTIVSGLPEAPILRLRSSLNHTIIQYEDGRIFGWGNCRKDQLGTRKTMTSGKLESVIWEPRELEFAGLNTSQPVLFDVGRDFSAFYSGKYHEYGKEVVGAKEQVSISSLENVVDVKTMWSSTHVITQEGDQLGISSFGNDSHGQLYSGVFPGNVKSFEIGSEHGLLATENNTVHAWGWGEHGNCGRKGSGVPEWQKLSKEAVTFPLNLIYSAPSEVLGLGAGCATTWIIARSSPR